mgnify:CR=1 FL=1
MANLTLPPNVKDMDSRAVRGYLESLRANAGGTISVSSGGTGLTSVATGSILAANATNVLSVVTSTSGTKVLTNTAGAVSWATAAGDVAGPASSTDNAIVRFDSTTGKLIQNSGITISDTSDITAYDATNDGNPEYRLGATDAEELHIQAVYDSAAQTLNYVLFQTDVASVAANKGMFRFNVDGTNILDIDDGGINLNSGRDIQINNVTVLSSAELGVNILDSSLTSVGTLVLGTWNADAIGVVYGGTGQTTYTNGQLLIGNTTGNTLAKATLTAGAGVSVTNGGGSITVGLDSTAFSATRSTVQSVPRITATKLQCATEVFDTDAYYDNVTNYRFTPLVAGKYQINWGASGAMTTLATLMEAYLYKNGALDTTSSRFYGAASGLNGFVSGSQLVDMNGTTDYLEIFVQHDHATSNIDFTGYFSGFRTGP